ncbi:uncharacterized protein At4g26450-like isoform X2 [Mangifera indica]|uniref:uncharacterized protein At4g26450-like isoform X2 n=1 Tax=Mangifera indica TaxID=29780 RepID=UPI001CFBA64B|nr:uncharacterized protein At4g26450-like isoform X2 [Mangifera indica]
MHAKHRSPGNGYRSNSMGMGMPPEGSARGRAFYSEYRSFNRGFGRGQGQPKSFQQSNPTLRKSDVFMEAGRLAAEYLVSQGLLPPSILTVKMQNGTFRSEDGENMQLPPEGTPALAHLANSGSDVGFGRRKYPDDNNSMGLRNYLNRRKKGGFFKSNSLDWGREYRRSGSCSEKGRISPDIEDDFDSYPGNQEEQQVSKDVGNGLQKPGLGVLAPKSDEVSGLESELEKYNIQGEMGSRPSSSSVGKDLLHDTDVEFSKKPVDSTNMDMEAGELKDEICNDEIEEQDALEESAIKHYPLEDDTSTKSNTDLLTLCRFSKMPTKIRSSLTYKGLKVDSVSNHDLEKTSDTILPIGSEVLVENNSLVGSAVGVLPDKTLDSKCPDSEISKSPHVQSVEGDGALGSVYGIDQGQFMRSQPFTDRVLVCDVDQELCQGLSDLQKSSSMVRERGEKRTMEEHDSVEATKKLREWFPSMVTNSNEHSNISSMSDNKASSREERAAPCKMSLAVDPENSVNSFQFPRIGGEPCVDYAREKQLFPGSFRICDLNLMEASDTNENHHSDPTLIFPTIPKKEATPVDIDLSMSNSIMSGEYSRQTNDGKEIEIIDLENDSDPTEKAPDNSERKIDMFTGMESFPNRVQNADHIPDVQDNYDGLMFTQLLNNFPDCPAVPVDINALQNEMAIHNGEGALGDDDSIYMSLGEIPLSMPDI